MGIDGKNYLQLCEEIDGKVIKINFQKFLLKTVAFYDCV